MALTPEPERVRIAAIGLGLLWLTMAALFAWRSSCTVDEFPHIVDGYTILTLGDRRMNPEHPPLAKVLGVLPAWLVYPATIGEEFETRSGIAFEKSLWAGAQAGPYAQVVLQLVDPVPFQKRLFLCRVVPMLWGLMGGVMVFMLATRLTGSRWAGIAAAAFLLFYPDYMGQACLLTMDAPLAVSAAAISAAAMAWWRRPDRARSALVVVVASLGTLVKLPVTAYVLFTLVTLFALSLVSGRRAGPVRVLLLGLAVLVGAWGAAWAGAGFKFSYLGEHQRVSAHVRYIPPVDNPKGSPILTVANQLWKYRLLPEASLGTITHLAVFKERRYYLNGVWSSRGWLRYFAVTALLKTPATMLLFLPIAAGLLASGPMQRRRSRSHAWRCQQWALLLVPMFLLLAAVVIMRANMGHRYVLFAYLPASVILAAGCRELARRRAAFVWGAGVLVAAHVAVCALAWPNLTNYFNPLGVSLLNATNHVRDTNTDMGQDIGELGRWAERNKIPRLNLALVSMNLPEAWGIEDYRMILPGETLSLTKSFQDTSEPDPTAPTAVSVNLLDMVRHRYPGYYDREPNRLIGSIAVFDP